MIYTDPKSCPICEGAVAIPSNHSCKDYYDDIQKRVITTSTSCGSSHTVNINDLKTQRPESGGSAIEECSCPVKLPISVTSDLSEWRSTPYQPYIGIPLPTKSANEIRLEIENKALREELSQQKFNNKHNLSIDGDIADKIAKLEAKLDLVETEREKLVALLDFYLNGR